MAFIWASWAYFLLKDTDKTLDHARAAIRLAQEHDIRLFEAVGTLHKCLAQVELGVDRDAIAQMKQALEISALATGSEVAAPVALILLATAYGILGQPEEGLSVLEEAILVANKNGQHLMKPEMVRLRGEFRIRLGYPPGETEADLYQAIELARRQEAKALELKAAISLARLWRAQGKKREAHRLLAPIFGWFTEGFDTADLAQARVYLEDFAGR